MFENLTWQGASVIISIVLVVGKLLVDFLSGKYSTKDNRTTQLKDNLRVADEKWKTHVDESLTALEEGQNNLSATITTFKSQTHTDIKGIHKRIDDFFKHLTERIDLLNSK